MLWFQLHQDLISFSFAEAVTDYLSHPDLWSAESRAGAEAADRFTYERYVQSVRSLILSGEPE